MQIFGKAFAGAFFVKLAASLVLAVAAVLGFAPNECVAALT